MSSKAFDGKIDFRTTNLTLIVNVHFITYMLIYIFMLFISKWNYFKASFITLLLTTLHVIITSILIELNIISPIFLGGFMILGDNRTVQLIGIPFYSILTFSAFVQYMMYGRDKPTNNTNRNKDKM